jgi:hypothetical protein
MYLLYIPLSPQQMAQSLTAPVTYRYITSILWDAVFENVKANLSLCLIKYHSKEIYEAMQI